MSIRPKSVLIVLLFIILMISSALVLIVLSNYVWEFINPYIGMACYMISGGMWVFLVSYLLKQLKKIK